MAGASGATMGCGTPLNLKQTALRLGVHYMTAYRYVRQGRLPARQEGSVWVVDEADVERFLSEREGPPAPREEDGRRKVDWAERVRVQLAMGHEHEAWEVVEAALASGVSPQRGFLELIGGSVAAIGDDVEAGGATTIDLRIATVTARRVAARLGTRFTHRRRPSVGTVVLGAPPGELHDLSISLIADVLRLHALDVLELGADVPPDAFVVAAERAERPTVVGLGVTRVDAMDAAREVVAALRAAAPDVPIVVGGQAVRSHEVAAVLGVDAWAPDGDTVVAAVERLLGTDVS